MKLINIILFLALFLGLILFQRDIINPMLFDIASSDLFLEEQNDATNLGSMQEISNTMTDIAFMHCNTKIRDDADDSVTINFPDNPIHAWDMGGGQYVINAELETTSDSGTPVFMRYVCRIHYSVSGNNEDDTLNYDNWSIYGISGLDDL